MPKTPESMPGERPTRENAPRGNAPGGGTSALASSNIPDGTYKKSVLKREIKVTKFNADNYMAWAHSMEIMLDAKELFRLVDGTEPMPNAMT